MLRKYVSNKINEILGDYKNTNNLSRKSGLITSNELGVSKMIGFPTSF